jgi:hypothetical protein
MLSFCTSWGREEIAVSGWVYVLELAPTGYIKVGQTSKLGARLATHIANASFGGASIARTFSVACDDEGAAERALLAKLHARPDAVLAHGKETFAGVTFMEAVAAADDAFSRRNAAPLARPVSSYQRLVEDSRGIMDAHRFARIGLAPLRELLATEGAGDDYAALSVVDLGRALRKVNIIPMTVHCPVSRRRMRGIKRTYLLGA